MAKSPTPIPAPPVKIQRDTNGAAPAAPATKPKKAAPKKRRKRCRNPLLWFLHGLIRRIYFGLKTASRLVLLVPILSLIHISEPTRRNQSSRMPSSA